MRIIWYIFASQCPQEQTGLPKSTVATSPRFNQTGNDDGADFGKLGQVLTRAPPVTANTDTQNSEV